MFLQVLCCIRYLARQGLALRGDGYEADGNFMQLLQMNSPDMEDRLKRKIQVYISRMQNDIIKTMAMNVLRSMQNSPFLTIMMDETATKNRLCRWNLEVHEEFIGLQLYKVPSIDANMMLTSVAKDIFIRLNLPLSKFGQVLLRRL